VAIQREIYPRQTWPTITDNAMFGKLFLFQHQPDEPFHDGIGGNTLQNMTLFIIRASPGAPNAFRAAFSGVLQKVRLHHHRDLNTRRRPIVPEARHSEG
jgi:hypothetical protein